MQNKKHAYVAILGSLALVIIVLLSGFAMAWYSATKKTIDISGDTSGVSFDFQIGVNEVNSSNFSINDLVFFDVDNGTEKNEFLASVKMLTFTITNTSSIGIDYTINQTIETLPASPYTGLTSTETAYVKCLFTTTAISSVDITNAGDISELYTNREELTGSLAPSSESLTTDTATFYVYVFGVQLNDDADNSFLDETYEFVVSMSAVNQ